MTDTMKVIGGGGGSVAEERLVPTSAPPKSSLRTDRDGALTWAPSLDPADEFFLFDDFFNTQNLTSNAFWSDHRFNGATIGEGSLSELPCAGTVFLRATTGTNSTARYTGAPLLDLKQADFTSIELSVMVKLTVVPNSTDFDFRAEVGLGGSSSSSPDINAIYFVARHASFGGNWGFVTRTGLVDDPLDTGVPIVADEWVKLSARMTDDKTGWAIFVNDVFVGTHTPDEWIDSPLYPNIYLRSNGTLASEARLYCDYYSLRAAYANNRWTLANAR